MQTLTGQVVQLRLEKRFIPQKGVIDKSGNI
jgi:hypothetical protein